MTWKPNAIGGKDGCPAVLFHGTKREHLDSIRENGLVPHDPHFWCRETGQHTDECPQSYEPKAVYLTDSLLQAAVNSGGIDREAETFDLDCLLVVDVTRLPLLRLGFYTCMEPIGPERIRRIADHPALRRQLRKETGW
jgi:hypothetical protein